MAEVGFDEDDEDVDFDFELEVFPFLLDPPGLTGGGPLRAPRPYTDTRSPRWAS